MSSWESQEQIVTILATFVHSNVNMIGSGWRPLFSALKALRIESNGTYRTEGYFILFKFQITF